MKPLGILILTASGLRGEEEEAEGRGAFSSTLWMEAQGMDDIEKLQSPLHIWSACLSVCLSACLPCLLHPWSCAAFSLPASLPQVVPGELGWPSVALGNPLSTTPFPQPSPAVRRDRHWSFRRVKGDNSNNQATVALQARERQAAGWGGQ